VAFECKHSERFEESESYYINPGTVFTWFRARPCTFRELCSWVLKNKWTEEHQWNM